MNSHRIAADKAGTRLANSISIAPRASGVDVKRLMSQSATP